MYMRYAVAVRSSGHYANTICTHCAEMSFSKTTLLKVDQTFIQPLQKIPRSCITSHIVILLKLA